MTNRILVKKGAGTPSPDDLEVAELALNTLNGELYTKLSDDSVVLLNDGADDVDLSDYVKEAPEDGKQYARQDAAWAEIQAAGNGNPVVISDDPPASPEEGDLWYSSKADDEGLYCWDGEVWFEAGGANGADGENGQDAKQIWSETTPDGDIYYNDGNVGIGTDTPRSALEVAGSYISVTNGDVFGYLQGVASSFQIGTAAASTIKELTLATSGATRMVINASGNTAFTGTVSSKGNSSIDASSANTPVNLYLRTNLSYNDASEASITLGPDVGPVANGRTFKWRIASGGGESGHALKFYKTVAPNNDESLGMYLDSSSNLTVNGIIFKNGSTPVAATSDLIKTLVTLRKATVDETQDIRESLRDAIDELVEGFEQEIAAGTMEISE